MRTGGRSALAVVGAVAFGLVAGWLHGNQGGLRAELGNVSAPWLFVAIIPAWWARSAVRGAAIGTATTLLALLGFYVALTGAMLGHLGNTHGVLASFELVLRSNRIWFVAGIISGPVCGALAGHLGARARSAWLGVLIGALMLGEVAVTAAVTNLRLPIIQVGWAGPDLRVAIPEAVLGLLTVGLVAAVGFRADPERG